MFLNVSYQLRQVTSVANSMCKPLRILQTWSNNHKLIEDDCFYGWRGRTAALERQDLRFNHKLGLLSLEFYIICPCLHGIPQSFLLPPKHIHIDGLAMINCFRCEYSLAFCPVMDRHVLFRVYFHHSCSVPRTGSEFSLALTWIKQLMKMDEWINCFHKAGNTSDSLNSK